MTVKTPPEDKKPADLVPGRSDQRASERGSEVAGGAMCEGAAVCRDLSLMSITSLTRNVKGIRQQ